MEDIPNFGTKDQAAEFLRRLQGVLGVQDRDETGFSTPYYTHCHQSMPQIWELYKMATKCPWGFAVHNCPGNYK